MTDQEILESIRASLDDAMAATQRQTDTIMQLSKVVQRYEARIDDLDRRLFVLESRMCQ